MNGQFARPRKALGQNFLQDQNIIRNIVSALNVKAGDVVIEIGPGRGALTELLIEQVDQLHLVEFDRDLSSYWRSRSLASKNVIVYQQDVLKFDFAGLTNQQRVKVIGNLPYNISSPILFRLLPCAAQIDDIVVMLQKEVVDRMVASKGNKQYGRLSVMLQQRFDIEMQFKVPPTAFFPPPKVESAIVRLTPLEKPVVNLKSHADFELIVKQAFSQRRKTLRNTLKGYLHSEQIEAVDIDPKSRAETLSVSDFSKLANLYSSSTV